MPIWDINVVYFVQIVVEMVVNCVRMQIFCEFENIIITADWYNCSKCRILY